MKSNYPKYFDDIVISTMEDNASVNFGRVVLKHISSVTKTNVISGQITGDNTTNYLLPIDSDLYDPDEADELVIKYYISPLELED
jgi:hypothetical protein